MIKSVFFLFLLLLTRLGAVEFQINSDNYNTMVHILEKSKSINEIISQKRVPYVNLQSDNNDDFDDSSKRNSIQKRYSYLKKLLVFLPKETKKSELRERLNTAFFNQNAQKKEEYSFIYKISYPNNQNIRGDDVFTSLQKSIALYILEKYGVSNIEDKISMTESSFSTYTKNYVVGTTESNFKNNIDNPYRYKQDKTTRSGVVSFIFYPFVLIKQNSQSIHQNKMKKKNHILKQFVEVTDNLSLKKLPFTLNSKDANSINSFLANYKKSYTVDTQVVIANISRRVNQYEHVAKTLFAMYPQCNTLACLDKSMSQEIKNSDIIKKKKEYSYNIDLSNDDDLEYVVLPAFRKLKKYLQRDTQMISFADTEIINNDNYSKNTMESKLVPVVKSVDVIPYIKENDRLGLHFKVNVSFEESDVCSQYYKGISRDKLYSMRFIKLQSPDGNMIEVSETEITNKVFNRIYPYAKKESDCEETHRGDEPVNCISDVVLDNFLERLNRRSQKYRYRYLSCKEAKFFATCGNKQKYCWGNRNNYQKYEFLRLNKRDVKLCKVASKRPNLLHLYDFCGNASEYCTDRYGAYKTFGSLKKHLKLQIKNSYFDATSLRLVRELK